jgi:DNA polymerase III delta subunit
MTQVFTDTGELQLRFALLTGDDVTSREIVRSGIINAIKKQRPDADIERYSRGDTPFSEFFERIITPSLLSPLRVFLVPDAHCLDEADFDLLKDLPAYNAPDACVILETEKLKAGKKSKEAAPSKKYLAWLTSFEEAAKQSPAAFTIMEFPKPPDYKMAEWVTAQVSNVFGRRISSADADHLVDLVGADTSMLHSELQKIDLFLDPKAPMTREAIDAVAGAARQVSQYELAQALGEKKLARALELIESMYTGSSYLTPVVGAIFRHFWSLFRIFQFTKANPAALRSYRTGGRQRQNEAAFDIAVASGVLTEKQANRLFPAVIKPRLVEQVLSFGPDDYKRIFALLAEFDSGLKTGRYDDSKTGFQVFCYRIVRGDGT